MTGRPSRRQGAGADAELAELLRPVVSAAGFDLEAVTVGQAGRRRVIKVIVDGDDGVSLDDVAAISRSASELLDGLDNGFGSGPYTLEVTSPGVDRPLTAERHWRRATGRLVQGSVGGKPLLGRVIGVDGDRVTLEESGREQTFVMSDLSGARVQVEFNSKRTGNAGTKE